MEFLLSEEDDVLFGGAARGGKSEALLMAGLQFVEYPGYSSIIIRKTFADLSQADGLIPRSHEWLGGKVKWDTKLYRWEWPNGSKLAFGYLDSEQGHFRYMGGRYQLVGIDEGTQHHEHQVRYLATRLSRPEGMLIPARLRITAMPGGIGHDWIKRRYITSRAARFISSKLVDNPYEDQASYLRSLNLADPVTRQQAMGDWDAIGGSRFMKEWLDGHHWHHVKGAGGWWADLNGERISLDNCVRFLTLDTASTVRDHSATGDPDYTACSAWASTGRYLIWLGLGHWRVEGPQVPQLVANMYQRYKAQMVYVEETGQNKPSQWLKLHQLPLGGYMNVKGYSKGSLDKLIFNTPFINMVAAGRVWLPGDDPMLSEIEGELLLFTGNPKLDAHDDIVDTGGAAARVVDKVRMSAAAANAPDYGYEPVGPRHGGMG